MVFSLVYSSAATAPFGDAELASLLAQSRAANAARDITGMLLYRGGRFIQILEGDETEVTALAARIAEDPRHTDMRVLLTESAERRAFADWTMGYQPIGVAMEPLPTGFRDTFDDLDAEDDASAVARAVRELSVWFRFRSRSDVR